MSGISKSEEVTRFVLKQYREYAANGELTTDDVINLVRAVVPGAKSVTIYRAIENYGPVGEGDVDWLRRTEEAYIPNRFYNPKTGELLA